MSSSKQLATLNEHINTGAPNPNPPDTQQRILDEDTYVDTLEHIITRDFYPDLYRLNKQNQNIDIIGTPGKDVTPTPIKQYKQYKLNENKTNNSSPKDKTFENAITPTPNQLNDTDNNHNKQIDIDVGIDTEENNEDDNLLHYVDGNILSNEEKEKMKHLNLKQFQNSYNSEDNYSFNEIMYKNQLQHYNKYPWIYQQQKNSDDRKKYLSILQSQNSNNANINDNNNTNSSIQAITLPKDTLVKDCNKTKAEIIQQHDEKKYSNEQELQQKVDVYHGELEFWKFKAVNKLMFYPEGDREQNLALMRKLENEYGKPECIYDNTRFPKGYKVPKNEKPKLTEMEKNLKGYSMVYTPDVGMDDGEGASDVLDDGSKGMAMFHMQKVAKKDKIIYALNKKNTDKLRKKQENKLRGSMKRNESVYTPYDTQRVMTPSGKNIDTPLVGMDIQNKKYRRQSSVRGIDMLSPAARKLMEKNAKMGNTFGIGRNRMMSTPLSSVLRDAYSTPKVGNGSVRSKNRKRKVRDETPKLIGDTPKVCGNKRRKLDSNGFEKPKYSIKDKVKKKKERDESVMNITDGLL